MRVAILECGHMVYWSEGPRNGSGYIRMCLQNQNKSTMAKYGLRPLKFFVYLFVSGESGFIWIVKMAAVLASVNQNIGENLAFSRVIDRVFVSTEMHR